MENFNCLENKENDTCTGTLHYVGLHYVGKFKAFSLAGTKSEVTSRIVGFNTVITLDPVQLHRKMLAELRLVKLNIEFSNSLVIII